MVGHDKYYLLKNERIAGKYALYNDPSTQDTTVMDNMNLAMRPMLQNTARFFSRR